MKRNLIEWGVIALVFIFLYVTGLHTEVASFFQRGILHTGIMNASPVDTATMKAPNILLTDLEGKPTSLEAFRGKVVFINFWATWCPPCVAEMPSIQALYQEVGHQEQIAFLLITTDQAIDKVHRFLAKKAYSLPVYRLAGALPAAYPVSAIPATFVVDPDGQLVYQHIGMANYHTEKFRQFLEGLAVTP
jgi:thiol-disulfide isomerase/thioredoxin